MMWVKKLFASQVCVKFWVSQIIKFFVEALILKYVLSCGSHLFLVKIGFPKYGLSFW
jgi:hypothetical protein